MGKQEDWGTFNTGRWGSTMGMKVTWTANDNGDPYNSVKIDGDWVPEWFDQSMSAKELFRRIADESGEEPFTFFYDVSDEAQISERINAAEMGIKCRLDPFYFLEHYKADIHYPSIYKTLSELARSKYPGHIAYVCVRPDCYQIHIKSKERDKVTVQNCVRCNGLTQVLSDILIEHGPPDPCLMAMALSNYMSISYSGTKSAILARMADESKYMSIDTFDYAPALKVNKDMPGIRVDGEHFIRGRVNREVLRDHGFNNYDNEMSDFIDGQDETVHEDLMMRFTNSKMSGLRHMMRIVEDPKVYLDLSKADKFRSEYIDTRWEEEFAQFVSALVDKKILKVDSSGVHDTITTLYHMAQRKAGKRTIIRKTGKIVFPTKDVLEIINPALMTRAFEVSEHAQYTDPSEVFMLGDGVTND